MNNNFDVVVIGSGIGGMAAAGLLAKLLKKKVLVLERHFELGGLTHIFRRGNYSWDVGLHYVGEMGNGEIPRLLFDFLTDGKLSWNKMPSPFEKFIYPDFTFEVPDNPERYRNNLIALFPDEEKAIKRYFRDIRKAAGWHIRNYVIKFLPFIINAWIRMINLPGQKLALTTTENYFKNRFKDNKLKAVLASQWGDYGLPPEESAFAIHSLIVTHYLKGGYYPNGGSSRIVQNIEMIVEKQGGECLVNQEVQGVIIENKKAVGVRVLDRNGPIPIEETFYAPIVISDSGAWNTYATLIPDKYSESVIKRLKHMNHGHSAVILFLRLKGSPVSLGVKGENYWINDIFDHNGLSGQTRRLLEGNPVKCYVSFPSIKDTTTENHTAEIIALCDYEDFASWQSQPWKRRETVYYELKEKIAGGLIKLAEKYIPGIKGLIEYQELSTPLTMEHFTNRINGVMYGIPATPDRYKLNFLKIRTPVQNIFLCGSDILSVGIVGALMGGVATVSHIMGMRGFFRILSEVRRSKKIYGESSLNIIQPLHPTNRTQVEGCVDSIEQLTDTVYEIIYQLERDVLFYPGQYAKIQVDETIWREYSIVELQKQLLKFIIETRTDGPGSKYILSLKPGDISQIRLPSGEFILHAEETGKVFIATGTGITPFIPMFQELADRDFHDKVYLYFGCRSRKDYFISRYIDKLKNKLDFHEIICLSREERSGNFIKGRVTGPLNNIQGKQIDFEYYISGNSNMIMDVSKLLRSKGVKRLYTENY